MTLEKEGSSWQFPADICLFKVEMETLEKDMKYIQS